MGEALERYEEGLAAVERLVGRGKNRIDGQSFNYALVARVCVMSLLRAWLIETLDLAQDYQDMAAAYQGLGYLESGITEPLNRFAEKMLDFSALLKHMVRRPSSHLLATDLPRTESDHRRALPRTGSFSARVRQRPSLRHQASGSETARFRRALRIPLGHRV